MGKNKLKRFAENETFENLFQHTDFDIRKEPFPLKGKWHQQYFKNEHAIILELGCGKGEYTLGMANLFPEKNFIGIDRKGARLWQGCKKALENKMDNVAFLRIKIEDIEYYFAQEEVDEIWVTFPDPQLKKERRRLISPNFISKYQKIINKNGIVHLKTDSKELYDYIIEKAPEEHWKIVANLENVYSHNSDLISCVQGSQFLTSIQTFYEKKWLLEEKTILYLAIKL